MQVGVLIPVHGFAPYLAETLDSVLGQDPAPAEVVVIDDGSREPTALHAAYEDRVRLVRRDTAGGPAVARAAGLDALPEQVDVIALCDSDDAWEAGKLAAQAAALGAEPGAGWCFGRARVVGPDGRDTGERWAEPAPGRHEAGSLGRLLYEANPIPTSSVVLRREALIAAGGFVAPVEVAEDWELWLRLARSGADAVCVPDARVRYRRHPGGLTADVARLAQAQIAVHTAHADLADDTTRRRVQAADLVALAAGQARDGKFAEARSALAAAAALRPPSVRERATRALLALPLTRTLVGRGDPYRT